jgi:two-component system chemotaxis response regulator CheB
MTTRPTKVLVVDDSAVVRKLIGDALRAEPDIQVVGGAADPFVARDLILQHEPDLLTLDIEMPRMDGLTFLRRIMEHRPMPVIIISSITQAGSAASLEAMRVGAIDVIAKPGGPHSVGHVTAAIVRRIRDLRSGPALRLARRSAERPAAPRARVNSTAGLVVIGASTGGTQAIEAVLTRLPAEMPPILIVQHMPPVFTRAFAERLDRICPLTVVEAAGGETLQSGRVYIAPGDHHLVVERVGLQLRTALIDTPLVHYQRPAVDVLFESAARLRGVPIVGVVLTGMGRDGADGLLALRHAGADTIAEDEQSCVVFGMPKEAIANGGARHVTTLFEMPARIAACLDQLNDGGRRASR